MGEQIEHEQEGCYARATSSSMELTGVNESSH